MKDKKEATRNPEGADWERTRREFLKDTGLLVAGLSAGSPFACADSTDRKAKLSFGIVTDSHYADADARGARHFRASLAKMTECVALMNDKKVDFLIEIGDLKDQDKPPAEAATLNYLTAIEKILGEFNGPRFHVLGNHDVDSISKEQFLARVENTGITKGATYYSFEIKGFHFVVLDANFKADGSDYDHGNFAWADTNIPPKQLDWLKKDLAASSKPVITFIHQRLDTTGGYAVKNAAAVRQVLQDRGNVLAVFQGHYHAGDYRPIEGIHYYTLKAMVEGAGEQNNAYAVVDVHDDNSIVVSGYRKAISRRLGKAEVTPSTPCTRRVVAMSDLHIGFVDDGQDGAYWLERALADLDTNVPPIDYGLVLGDLTQNGFAEDLKTYLRLRDASRIPAWYELAGNHEYYRDNIGHYRSLIRSTEPYAMVDGNLAFLFMSDMEQSRSGQWTPAACDWLEEQLRKHRDKVIVVCSHQLVPHTVRNSDEAPFCLNPAPRIKEILAEHPIDLWLCGHEHHSPYTAAKIARHGNTTFINIASLSHAYGTGVSGSIIMDFVEGATAIRIRRRSHDDETYLGVFDVSIPLRTPCRLGPRTVPAGAAR